MAANDQFPSIDTWKLSNFQVLLLGNCQFPGNNARKFDNFQLPGNNTQKLTKRQKCWVNFWVTIPGHFQFQSIVTYGHFQFQSIVTRKIDKFPGNNTRKLYNLRVWLPGSCFEKILLL